MRFKIINFLFLISMLVISCQPQTSKNEPSASDPKAELAAQLEGAVLWYQNSAEMQMSYLQAYQHGKLLLNRNLENHEGEKPAAVVLDLDETVLDNSPYEGMLIKTGKTYTTESWIEWVSLAEAKALPGAADFVNHAKEKGVEVFYISNRENESLAPTIKNLEELGLPNADSLHILLKKDTSDKTTRRNKISSDFDILVFVGDNLTDFSQIYANRDETMGKALVNEHLEELLDDFVMLPNPMYGEWEKAIYKNDYSITDSTKLEWRKQAIRSY